jgi:hypothetical protein
MELFSFDDGNVVVIRTRRDPDKRGLIFLDTPPALDQQIAVKLRENLPHARSGYGSFRVGADGDVVIEKLSVDDDPSVK